jgi:hypothetical protein
MDLFAAQIPDSWQRATSNAEEAPATVPMEHRWGTRRLCKARVQVSGGRLLSGPGSLRDISMSGAFLETALALPLFAELEIDVLRRDGSSRALGFPAVVVRQDAGGVGIEWCDPNPGAICCKLGCSVQCDFQECTGP